MTSKLNMSIHIYTVVTPDKLPTDQQHYAAQKKKKKPTN